MLQPSLPTRSRVLLTSCRLAVAVALVPAVATAAPPGFDLDLKELKKPSAVIVTPKKQTPVQKVSKTAAITKITAKKAAAPAKTIQPPKKLVSPPAPIQTPVPRQGIEQIVILDGATACRLALLLLKAVAEPVPPAEVLQGLSLPVAAAAHLQGATALLTCGLPTAEAYTFRRLLEVDGIQLINLTGDEQAIQVVQAVAQGLGLSYYRLLQETPLSYLTNDHQGRPIRLVIGDSSTSN